MQEIQRSDNEQAIQINNKTKRPNEDARLFSVLSHITLGIVGIVILLGIVKSVKGDRFVMRHALTAIFNGIISVLIAVIWYLTSKVIGTLTGPQMIQDIFQYGMIGLILIFFLAAFIASVGAARGKDSKIPWAYPIAKALIK
jgi:uncharacterized membrane protein